MPLVLIHEVTLDGEPGAFVGAPHVSLRPAEPVDVPVRLHARFFLPIPAGTPRGEREQMRNARERPMDGPAACALLAAALDVLRGEAFVDERCVAEALVYRYFGEHVRTELRVFTL